jgi:4-amino-4-deoxy-L-arabinose transferase-like glycosyltransferase
MTAGIPRKELLALAVVLMAGLGLRVAYVLLTQDFPLTGDQPEYHSQGRLIADGMWFWTALPYGELHAGMWKAPGYPAFLGVVYTLIGPSVTGALLVQALIGPVVIAMVWLLARRLFDARVALVAAALAAVYPHMWQWELRLYPEGFALPVSLLVMLLVLERTPSTRRAAVVGVVMGVGLLVRPTQFFLFALIVVAWTLASGPRRGVALTALAVVCTALTVAPWTVRNYIVADDLIPISMQDSAAYGTFNDEARDDPRFPWAWRAFTRRERDLFDPARPLPDGELRERLQGRAFSYIADNPLSVPKAFFWNGLSRTWDVRRPSNALVEIDYDGRTRAVATVGLVSYWLLLVAALAALWRLRARRGLVLPLLAGGLAMSVVFTTAAATRYRLPYEPVIVCLASTVLVSAWDRVRGRWGQSSRRRIQNELG